MNALTKIFIAEQDCESLVSTMLWLEQYPDFEIYGAAILDGALAGQIEEVQPDVVMLGINALSAQAALHIKGIRSTSADPAVMLVTKSDTGADAFLADCDGQIGPKTTLKDMPDLIRKAINRRRISSIASSTMPMAKAG